MVMNIDVVLIPAHLNGRSLAGKTVIVFDVLRATTTIASAFSAGVTRIRAFADLAEARAAAASAVPRPILCGEQNALPAPGVDLGNSPRQFRPEHAGREIYLSTTNGTKAMNAARSASVLLVAALVNASLAAKKAAEAGLDAVLLGSGTNAAVSMEDTIGAGAVCAALIKHSQGVLDSDLARMAHRLFISCREDLPATLRDCQGGRNIIHAGLEPDIDFAARLDVIDVLGAVNPHDLTILPVK
jgi:2-phosphosulfolactate phosphatase